jgi:ABC-type cobalt transport system substrate-binding protein
MRMALVAHLVLHVYPYVISQSIKHGHEAEGEDQHRDKMLDELKSFLFLLHAAAWTPPASLQFPILISVGVTTMQFVLGYGSPKVC